MIKNLGLTLKIFTPALLVVALILSFIPSSPVAAQGESFAFADDDKKTIVMTGGALTAVDEPAKLEFTSTDGKVFVIDPNPTIVTLAGGAKCNAVGRIDVNGAKITFAPQPGNQCEFMNKVDAGGTVVASGAQTNCSAAGTLSWIICPLSDMAQGISKTAAGIVEGLLYVEPLTLNTGPDNAIYVVWELVRNIANIVFIILFLIIIFSQATSMGMSNYGIKRMLPRLLIMAILVNLSYFLCAFAVDVANLIGAGVKGLVQVGITAAPDPNLNGEQWDGSYGGFITALIAAIIVLAVAGPLWGILATIFSVVMFAILIGFVVLVVRQVLITLLIIISPLAFVAALLPNTESWFGKWRKTFMGLLLSYPILMFIFYGSALVATVVGAAMMPK
jgi:hypothetical protein